MKKIFALLLALLMMVNMTACKKNNDSDLKKSDISAQSQELKEKHDKTVKIVSTLYAPYDWVNNLIKDCSGNYQVDYLLKNGADLHSYQPTAEDLAKISQADMVIHVGGPADEWLNKALENAGNKDVKIVNLMEVLSDKLLKEELVSGMQDDHDGHDHDDHKEHDDHDDHDDHDKADNKDAHHDHEHGSYDEHLWLSLDNAEDLVEDIAEKLADLAPEDKKVIEKNEDAYEKKLDELDDKFEKLVKKSMPMSQKNTYMLFADRFPFRYFVEDYKIPYSAAFPGCSADSKASFQTISFLAQKLDDLNLHYLFTIEASDQAVAKAIIENSKNKDAKILTFHSMQIMNDQDKAKGYLGIMEENYKALEEAFN